MLTASARPPRTVEVTAIGDLARASYRAIGRETASKWYTAAIDASVRKAGESIETVVRRTLTPVVDVLELQLRVVDALATKLERSGRLPMERLEADEDALLVAWAGARLGAPLWWNIVRPDRRRYFREVGRNHEFRASELGAALSFPTLEHETNSPTRPDHLEAVLVRVLEGLTCDTLAGLHTATIAVAAPAVRKILRPAIEPLRARATAQARMLDVLHPSQQSPRVIMDLLDALMSMAGPTTRRRNRSPDDKRELCHEFWVRNSRGEIDWHGLLLKDLSHSEYQRLLSSSDRIVLSSSRPSLSRGLIDVEASVRRALSWVWDSLRPSVVPAGFHDGEHPTREDTPESKHAERRALHRFHVFVAVIELHKLRRIPPVILLEIAQLRTTELGRELTWSQLLAHIATHGSSTTRNHLAREDRPSDAAIISDYHRKCKLANGSDTSIALLDTIGVAPGSLSPDSAYYVCRDADDRLGALLRARRDPVIVLTGPRKIGKTTAAKRAAQKLGAPHVYLSLQNVEGVHEIRTADELERLLVAGIDREHARSGASDARLVVLDEVDLVPKHLRPELVRWLRKRAWVTVLVGVFPIEDAGDLTTVALPPFDRARVKAMIRAYNDNLLLTGEDDVSRLLRELGGNPYLVHLAVHTITNHGQSLLTFLGHAFEDRNPLFSFLRGLAGERAAEPELFAGLHALLDGRAVHDPALREGLVRHGLAMVDGEGRLAPLCGIYRLIFDESYSSGASS